MLSLGSFCLRWECLCASSPYLVYLPVDKGGPTHLFICSCCMPNGHVPSGRPACAACLKGEDWGAMALSRCFRSKNITMHVNMSTGATTQKNKTKNRNPVLLSDAHSSFLISSRLQPSYYVHHMQKQPFPSRKPAFCRDSSKMPNTPRPTLHTLCFICKFPHIWGKNTVILFKPAYILICFQHKPPSMFTHFQDDVCFHVIILAGSRHLRCRPRKDSSSFFLTVA